MDTVVVVVVVAVEEVGVLVVEVGVLVVKGVEAVVVGVDGGGRFEGERRLPRKRFRARSRSCSICWSRLEVEEVVIVIVVGVCGIVVGVGTVLRVCVGVWRRLRKRFLARSLSCCIFCLRDMAGSENMSGCWEVKVWFGSGCSWPRRRILALKPAGWKSGSMSS